MAVMPCHPGGQWSEHSCQRLLRAEMEPGKSLLCTHSFAHQHSLIVYLQEANWMGCWEG